MSTKLKAYLAETEPDIQTLGRWCQGLGLPLSLREGEEPFTWIVGGLPVGAGEATMRHRLADRAAALLNHHPDENLIGPRPDMLLYNLLKLCAELNCPDELSGPLLEMFHRGCLRFRKHLGVPLWEILLHALAYNQVDNRMEADWRNILERPVETPRYNGFVGSVMMPRSGETRGEPDTCAIGYALKWMAVEFEGHRDRRDQFRGVLKEAKSTYLAWPSFHRDMVAQANQHDWPAWSIESLLKLFLPAGNDRVILWARLGECVSKFYHFDSRTELCGGLVWDVGVNGASTFLTKVAPIVERHRVEEKKPSDRAMVGALNEGLIEAAEKVPEYAQQVEEMREQLLEREDALVSQSA